MGTHRVRGSTIAKKPRLIDTRTLPIAIPIEILKDRELSALEAIVRYLKDEHNLTYSQIATMLQRDDRTVWTTYQRSLKKVVRE